MSFETGTALQVTPEAVAVAVALALAPAMLDDYPCRDCEVAVAERGEV